MAERIGLATVLSVLFALGCAARSPMPMRAGEARDAFQATAFVHVEFQAAAPDAAIARELLRADFERRQRFVVLDARDEADAYLVTRFTLDAADGTQSPPQLVGHARLIDRVSGRVVWQKRVEPRAKELPSASGGARSLLLHAFVLELSAELHRAAGP